MTNEEILKAEFAPPKHPYAVVMTAVGMLESANAFINGLDFYGNEVDFYLIGKDSEAAYVKKAQAVKDLKVDVRFYSIEDCFKHFPAPTTGEKTKRGGWHVRFYRYKVAELIAPNYSAVSIIDADMLCMNNIMRYFEIAEKTGLIVLPWNSVGYSVDRINDIGYDVMRGAACPPYHNMPLFIDPKKWNKMLQQVFQWGLDEPFGDMVTLSKVLFRYNYISEVWNTPNQHWIQTVFYHDMIEEKKDNKLYCALEPINTIHRRWWNPGVCEKFVNAIKGDEEEKKGRNNVKLFYKYYKKFNTEHKVKIDWPWTDPKI